MSPRDLIIKGVRELLEQQYLESVAQEIKDDYAALNKDEKRKVLKEFLHKLTAESGGDSWAERIDDIL
jgi:hypothetical protein